MTRDIEDIEITNSIREIKINKAKKKEAEQAIEAHTEFLVSLARRDSVKSMDGEYLGDKYRISVVNSETVVYDSDALEKALDGESWDEITKATVNSEMIKKAILSGRIPLELITKHSLIKKRKPHLRISVIPQ